MGSKWENKLELFLIIFEHILVFFFIIKNSLILIDINR